MSTAYFSPRKSKSGFTLIELLVVMVIIGVLIGLLMAAVQGARKRALDTLCIDNQKNLTLALITYDTKKEKLPPGSVLDLNSASPETERRLSWAAFILPELDETPYYEQILVETNKFNIPWTTANGLGQLSVEIFGCPADPSNGSDYINRNLATSDSLINSNYLGVMGDRIPTNNSNHGPNNNSRNYWQIEHRGMLYVNSRTSISAVRDGTSNTFLIGERDAGFYLDPERHVGGLTIGANTAQEYLDVLGFCRRERFYRLNANPEQNNIKNNDSDCPAPGCIEFSKRTFSSYHGGGAYFGFGDGHVQFISDAINNTLYESLASRAGLEGTHPPE